MNFIKRLFSAWVPRRPVSAGSVFPVPHPGESWILDCADGSPLPREPGPVVTVREVLDGWVRYDMDRSRILVDQRTTLKTFRKLYRPNAEAQGREAYPAPACSTGDRPCS